jgi:hypothetical protein
MSREKFGWKAWLTLGHSHRKLEVSAAGHWYLVFTVGLGVAALTSGNNVLYLIESLLLSGLILSGVLSERTVSGVECEIYRGRAWAGKPAPDRIRIQNLKKEAQFCVEILEWKKTGLKNEWTQLAFLPRLGPEETILLSSSQTFPTRGEHSWDGLAIATRWPFGFARKIKPLRQPGRRLIWPETRAHSFQAKESSQPVRSLRPAEDPPEGQVRPKAIDEDWRRVVWTVSARNPEEPWVRLQPPAEPWIEAEVRVDQPEGQDFELSIQKAARFLKSARSTLRMESHFSREAPVRLWLVGPGPRRKKIEGRIQALNALATLRSTDSKEPKP